MEDVPDNPFPKISERDHLTLGELAAGMIPWCESVYRHHRFTSGIYGYIVLPDFRPDEGIDWFHITITDTSMKLFGIKGCPTVNQLWNIAIAYADGLEAHRFGLLRLVSADDLGSFLTLRLTDKDRDIRAVNVFWREINHEIYLQGIAVGDTVDIEAITSAN